MKLSNNNYFACVLSTISNDSYGDKCISLAKGLGNFLQEFLQHRREPLTFPTVTGYHLAFYTYLFNDKLKIISEKKLYF